ncbi:MAG: hypothetical protein HY727_19825 [Candidatus Rokubacteria bacterium]|nr:hypothetical protein [Candidatus Rokubacteria bacterium]
MAQSLTERIQSSRVIVVEIDKSRGRVRVRGEADACTDLACSEQTLVVTDEEVRADLSALHPGDIVKVEPTDGRPERIVVVRRAWEELASPEL